MRSPVSRGGAKVTLPAGERGSRFGHTGPHAHALQDGPKTPMKCPEAGCRQRLVYQESATAATILALGGAIVIPIERHFYRCPKHGLFSSLGGNTFSPVE